MSRLLKFLSDLGASKFYGEVRIRFRDGQIAGPISVQQDFIEETLPRSPVVSVYAHGTVPKAVPGESR